MERVAKYPAVSTKACALADQVPQLVDLCVTVQQIPAPTGHEELRAQWVAHAFRDMGLADVYQDEEKNTYGRIPGYTSGPALLVSAHTDTVFEQGTDLTVRRDQATGYVYGPGIGDNSAGVAALITLADTFGSLPKPPVDVWLVANSGEEGLGDLRGMRAAVNALYAKLGAAIVIEGMGLGRIVHRALGSRRYRIHVTAPGGHSWSDFGACSALHVLIQLADELTRLHVPEKPRTTFNIGRVEGGTSVNSIAQRAWLELDLRSEDVGSLQSLVDQVLAIVERYRTLQWQEQGVQVIVETIGDRPAGEIAAGHPLVAAAQASLVEAGYTGAWDLRISSTDANIPLSCGIPAVCIGVTEGGNAHRLEEWIQTRPLAKGMAHLLFLTWWAADWLAAGQTQREAAA